MLSDMSELNFGGVEALGCSATRARKFVLCTGAWSAYTEYPSSMKEDLQRRGAEGDCIERSSRGRRVAAQTGRTAVLRLPHELEFVTADGLFGIHKIFTGCSESNPNAVCV